MATLASMLPFLFFQLLFFIGSNNASAAQVRTQQTNRNHFAEDSILRLDETKHRKLTTYALYNLDKFSVRFLTGRTDELERAHASALESKTTSSTTSDIGKEWIMVSETGGLESSLSYPMRTVTQDFLYLGFQNLIDDWLLELNGGPDGNNDLSYRNVTDGTTFNGLDANSDGDFGGRFLQLAAKAQQEGVASHVYNLEGGDSTGEKDYNEIGNKFNSNAVGTKIEIETSKVETVSESSAEQNLPSETAEAQPQESTPTESTRLPIQNESAMAGASQIPPPPPSGSSNYVNIYEGLVYHSMYEHLVTVDLRVKLYLRKNGVSGELDSVRRNLRSLEDTGEAELLAEVSPTIAFLEPVSEAKRRNKPSNSDVRELFGGWMEYMFTRQRGVYIRTLKEYEDQPLLQEISTLRVEVETSPLVSAANSSHSGPSGAWSQQTQKAFVSMLIVLGIVALIWPMYVYGQHVKKHRRITLQLMDSEGGAEADEYDFSGSFSSVTYKDNVEDALKLPPINPSIAPPNSLPKPQSMSHRGNSLDAMRHGTDVFPSRDRDLSQKTAMSALEASDRYLSRHRPDLFYDQHSLESKGTVNVFGRVYEIPSNPFDFIFKGGDQQQKSPQQQLSNNFSPTGASDLGRNAHFPFASSRSSFSAPRPAAVGSNPYGGRSTSVGSTGSASNANHFAPIVEPNQNLAAGMDGEDYEGRMTSVAAGIATGHSWQNNETQSFQQVHPSYSEGTGRSVIGNIFRNLSISSWYNGNNINNSYTANSQMSPEFYPTSSGGTEEVYYDDYHHQHQDPSLFQREIELESLPNDEESPANYDFAFQDFPRKDGTPCLIIDDDSFLSERKRRESAKMIFNIDDEVNLSMEDDGSLTEKKVDSNTPVSDEAFKMMLSQNALDIDNSVIQLGDSDDSMVLPPLESSFLNMDPYDAKSQEFQSKLSRLMETKQQRYTRENKNAAIVAANRKKRKNVRERERVDRHKAIERELEDIEAEFSLTMQPLSPNRNKTSANSITHGHHTPKRNLSPKPPAGASRHSPMPSRMAASPARKNIAALSPSRSNLSSIAANSPARSSMNRNRGISRTNSNNNSHRRQNSLGASPFRAYNPRARRQHSLGGNSDIFRSATQRPASPPSGIADFDGVNYKPKMRPLNMMHGMGNYDDLSLPNMGAEKATFKSPQAVIDEVLQSGAQTAGMQKPRHYHQRSLTPTRTRTLVTQRSLTPSKMRPGPNSRRTNSFDVNDDSFQRRIHPSGPSHLSTIGKSPSVKPNSNSNHRRTRSGSIGSNHRRTSSRDDDMFLHGVVAQTRFI